MIKVQILRLISLIFIAIVGVIHLPDPFTGDTAMFMAGAKAIENGGVYYIDFWDVKQPGIYLFFWQAGKLFGFNEIGAHLLDLLWMLTLSYLLIKVTEEALENKWLSIFTPITSVGLYYIYAGSWHLTQVEILVSLPLLVTLWLGTKPYQSSRGRAIGYFLAGCAIGVTTIFKTVYFPLGVSLLLLPLYRDLKAQGSSLAVVLTNQVVPAVLGIALVFSALIFYLLQNSSFSAFYWATFIYPMEVAREISSYQGRQLLKSILWLGGVFATCLPLLVVAAVTARKYPRNIIFAQFMVWLFFALALVLIQKYSWWEYQFLLLFVPLGVLTIFGLDRIVKYMRDSGLAENARYTYVLAVVIVFYLIVGGINHPWSDNARQLAISIYQGNGWGEKYRKSIDTKYRAYWKNTRFLHSPNALQGDIFIFGDPMMLMLSGRKQAAIPLNAWGINTTVKSQWDTLPGEFEEAYVPYVFISTKHMLTINNESPGLIGVLNAKYRELHKIEESFEGPLVGGTWYEILRPKIEVGLK